MINEYVFKALLILVAVICTAINTTSESHTVRCITLMLAILAVTLRELIAVGAL